MLAGVRRVAGVLPDRRRPHCHAWLWLAHAPREIRVGGRNELAETRAGRGIPVERVTQLVEHRHVETEARRHAERRREATEIGGLATDGRRVQRGGLAQPGDMHGARV